MCEAMSGVWETFTVLLETARPMAQQLMDEIQRTEVGQSKENYIVKVIVILLLFLLLSLLCTLLIFVRHA